MLHVIPYVQVINDIFAVVPNKRETYQRLDITERLYQSPKKRIFYTVGMYSDNQDQVITPITDSELHNLHIR